MPSSRRAATPMRLRTEGRRRRRPETSARPSPTAARVAGAPPPESGMKATTMDAARSAPPDGPSARSQRPPVGEGRDGPCEREQEEDGEQAHVEAREGQEVSGARAGEEVGELGREPAPIPEDEGGEQAGRGGVGVSQAGTDPSLSESMDRASIRGRWRRPLRSPDDLIGPGTQAAGSRSRWPVQATGPAGSPRTAVHGDEISVASEPRGATSRPASVPRAQASVPFPRSEGLRSSCT